MSSIMRWRRGEPALEVIGEDRGRQQPRSRSKLKARSSTRHLNPLVTRQALPTLSSFPRSGSSRSDFVLCIGLPKYQWQPNIVHSATRAFRSDGSRDGKRTAERGDLCPATRAVSCVASPMSRIRDDNARATRRPCRAGIAARRRAVGCGLGKERFEPIDQVTEIATFHVYGQERSSSSN
jgi:hypothetical protein